MQFEKVYIHKCYKNELGYRNDIPKKAGRFIVANFFPCLSRIILNVNILIDIIDLNNKVVACNYVYHNSKSATNNNSESRDEYRLYIPSEIDINRDLFKADDIIAFTKYKISDKIYFKLNLFPVLSKDNQNYNRLNKFLLDTKSSKSLNHLLVDLENIEFLRSEININSEKIISDDTIEIMSKNQKHLFDNLEKITEQVKEVPSDETGLIKSNNFRDIVLFAYMNKCAITRKAINYEALSNLEAAHIMPQSHNGPNAVPNGMALCRDLHWAFDKGFFTIKYSKGDYVVEVHKNTLDNELLKEIDGIKIFKPSDPRFRLHSNALEYHQKHIFGTFKQSRSK